MEIFEIIVGVSSIGSFIVSIIALIKVSDIQNKTKQIIKDTDIKDSTVIQTGRDYKGK